MSTSSRSVWFFFLLAFAVALSGCTLDSSGTAPPPRTLGGRVTGLVGELTLFGGGSAVTVKQDGQFAFPRLLSEGEPYQVVVLEAPAEQRCSIQNGSGVISGADVVNIDVTCGQGLFQVGGSVGGLKGEITLENGSGFVTVSADGSFSFPTLVEDGAPYAVKVYAQPADQVCRIAKGTGVIAGADVTDVVVSCDLDDARLLDLTLSQGALAPAFSPETALYWSEVGLIVQSVAVTPTAVLPDATILVNGEPVLSGTASAAIPLDLGSNFINVHVTAPSGATRDYAVLVNRDEKLAETYLKASNASVTDGFGYAIALSGDTLAVGAPSEDSNAKGIGGDQGNDSAGNSGAVYVFVRSAAGWTQEAYIKASNAETNDAFGTQVALDGDTLVVGAPTEDSNATGIDGDQANNSDSSSGAVYVFVRSGTTWTQEAYIKASNTDANDQFGASVAISGDTLAVGADLEDSASKGVNGDGTVDGSNDSGAAYVFVRSGTTWAQQAYIKALVTDNSDSFGTTVALSGDTLVVGATAEDSNAIGINGDANNDSSAESGAAYVFVRSGTTWAQQAYIKASNTDALDYFGTSLALAGDTLVVGAYGEDSGASGIGGPEGDDGTVESGAVYVFTRSGATWAQTAYIKASNPDAYDYFGASVALSGDTLAVGAQGENGADTGLNGKQGDNTATDAGAVYLFSRAEGKWAQVAYVKAPNTDGYDAFGASVALSGDTLVCAAPNEDGSSTGIGGNPYTNTAAESGAVFVYP
jgi:trimeric autotransporter adhesin